MGVKKKSSFVTMCMTAGAFISYTVGSGFASGNEVLQFYGSWGFPGIIIALLCGVAVAAIYCVCLFYVGRMTNIERAADVYTYFGGKWLGGFLRIFVYVFICGCYMLMFSGAGSLLEQQFGIPKWVGAVLLGVISLIVLLGGLKTVESVLGCAGIVILGYVFVFAVISIFNPGSGLDQAAAVEQAAETGKVWQANLFGMPPLSWIPGLSELNNAPLEGALYAALCSVSGFPFYFTLGKRARSGKEAVISGVVTAIAFYACVACSLFVMVANGNSLVNPATDQMYDFPMVAAVNSIWPAGSWTYALIIFVGIFTTTVGYLWVINDLLFPGSQGTLTSRGRILVAVLLVIGICLGGVIPFSALINFMFPLSGVVGLILTACEVRKALMIRKDRAKQLEQAEMESQP